MNSEKLSKQAEPAQMGKEGQDRVKKFVSLAFDLSGELERKSWMSAEVTIRSMIEIDSCYPGWHLQQSLGYVKPGRFWDSTYFMMVRKGFCEDTLRYLLALTVAFQGRCPDALQELEKIKMGTLNMVSWVDSLKERPELQELFPAETALVRSCQMVSSMGHQ